MFGCGLIWGAVAVLAVFKLRKLRRFGGCHGFGYGGYGGHGACGACGPGGWSGGPDGPGFAGGIGRFGRMRSVVRGMFMRLGTTPGQEKVIVQALEELRAAGRGAKDGLRETRKDFADAFRRGPIDEPAMADIFSRHDTLLSETRRKAVEAVGKIHEALDEQQRSHLADILERGFGYRG